MKLRMTAHCACGPVRKGVTQTRTPSSGPAGSTYASYTSTCSVCAHQLKRPGLLSSSSPKTIPMKDT